MKRLIVYLGILIAVSAFAGTWVASPGKGSHAAAGGGNTVTIDTSAKGGGFGATVNASLSITVASNSNRVLYVFIGTGSSSGTDEVGSVSSSLNGALTQVGSAASDSAWQNSQVWRLINPSVGTHSITTSLGGQALSEIMAISLYNVDTTTPNDTITLGNGTAASSTPSGSVTLTTGEMAVGFLGTDGETGLSVTVGTQRQETENVQSDSAFSLATNTGTGTVSVAWAATSATYALIVVPVNAAP